MRIGIVGMGRVGRGVAELFDGAAELVTYDKLHDGERYPREGLRGADLVVVCVDTPPHPREPADLAAVEEAVRRTPNDRLVIKSTVPPGTTERLARETGKTICFWPEFIGESRYVNPFFPTDMRQVPFVILGGPPNARRWLIDRLLPILGPTKTYFQCSATEAELVKYAENSYFATKITFVNEYRRICEAFGADWHTVREGWLLDPRVEPMHTAAFADAPGFSGKCLPKDVLAIVRAASGAGYRPGLLAQVLASNEVLRGEAAGSPAELAASRAELAGSPAELVAALSAGPTSTPVPAENGAAADAGQTPAAVPFHGTVSPNGAVAALGAASSNGAVAPLGAASSNGAVASNGAGCACACHKGHHRADDHRAVRRVVPSPPLTAPARNGPGPGS